MYYYNNELPTQYGWICPKCGRVNAPWLPTCDCVSSQTRATFDTTSLTAEQTEPQTDEPTWEQVKEYCNKRCLDIVDSAMRKQWYTDEPQTEEGE